MFFLMCSTARKALRGDNLHGRAPQKPVDDGATANRPKQHGGVGQLKVQQRLACNLYVLEHQYQAEDHRRGARPPIPIKDGFWRLPLTVLPARIVRFQVVFTNLEIGLETEISIDFLLDSRNVLRLRLFRTPIERCR